MTNVLYSVKDELSEFAAPIMIKDDALAKRYFREMIERTPIMKGNPTDFSIWAIGEFDTNTGIAKAYGVPTLIERGQKNDRREDQETL